MFLQSPVFCSAEVGSSVRQVLGKTKTSTFPMEDLMVFPGQKGYIVPPQSSGSGSQWDVPGKHLKGGAPEASSDSRTISSEVLHQLHSELSLDDSFSTHL
ncbi:hypothetical protein CHARACLAT_005615 [Characodon lateralis]|uniref:Uncharacterized protein n=1 Tax=Characodon lateralis TaxID=208331 RepID=A0ABU7DYY2_9TELE|nr:hypothetical protein [Characodon lateralis]